MSQDTPIDLTFEMLGNAIAGHAAAIRCRSVLQPAAGEGTKVFPPTHSGGAYATEQRRLPGREQPVECVLLDSVQSQANRMEEALQDAVDREVIELPLIVVEFGDQVADIQRVTSLQAPHRAADAILRDSLLDGEPFRKSKVGERITESSLANATALFEFCPHSLVFGVWDSTGPKGGLGAKFARAMVSEVVGIDSITGKKTASRIDPIETRKTAGPLYHRNTAKYPGIEWTLDENEAILENKKPKLFARGTADTKSKPGEPSKANHGNYPPEISDGGVTISHSEHTAVLSLPQLRRLRFPIDGKFDTKRDDTARTVLAALALVGLTLAAERGFDLRSRCLLFPNDALKFELLETPGKPTALSISSKTAIAILKDAVDAARKLGLKWNSKPIVLKPSPQLIELVKKSQALAANATEGGEQ